MAMTLAEAAAHIGGGVVYQSPAQRAGRDTRPPEDGTIERVGTEYVFVRYSRSTIAATRPEDLTLLTTKETEDETEG